MRIQQKRKKDSITSDFAKIDLGKQWFFWSMLLLSLWGCVTTSQKSTYTIFVSKGDTLAGIAQKYDSSTAQIMRLNGLKKPVVLRIGQKLVVAPGPLGIAAGQELLQPAKDLNRPRDPRAGFVRRSSIAEPSEFKEGDFPQGRSKNGENFEGDDALDLGSGEEGSGQVLSIGSARVPKDPQSGRQKTPPRPKKGLFFGNSSQLNQNSGIQTSLEKAIDDEFDIIREDDSLEGLDALAVEPMRWPLRGSISSNFGHRHGRLHRGVDLKAPHGTPLWASAEGTVVYAGWKKRYGKVVIIQHRFYQTLYAHLSAISVKSGEWVDLKKAIGRVGATGNARGTHLHFEVIARFNEPLDPVVVMSKSQSLRVAAARGNRSRNTRIQ